MRVGYTLGMGIGPEIFPLALERARVPAGTEFILCGNQHDPQGALLHAIELAKLGEIGALVTGPVRKSILENIDGRSYPGQTELLHAHLAADASPPLMCFAGGPFLLGLATVHTPIREVSSLLTEKLLSQKLQRLIEGAAKMLNKPEKQVHVTVLGLNPHAGEGGLIGDEEQLVIEPVIQRFQKEGYQVVGPTPADGFFGYRMHQFKTDAVLAMMHDQGLGPYKLHCKGKVANLTFGLKILRASPAHGTAEDLVGTGRANPDSLIKAVEILTSMQSGL
ncbi:MAG: 4-hydroxythreonine-4-phosphate dehydrogenase PdxA [Myxococcota bacterium]